MDSALAPDYQQLLLDMTARVRQAQYQALRLVNRQQLELYWELGRLIVERQQQYGWGKQVVETLARDLQRELAGLRGFSATNLWRMRSFYLAYPQPEEKLAQTVRELGWGHNITLLEQCPDPTERLFYAVQARRHSWSRHVLSHQISTRAYQKTLQAQHNFDTTLPPEQLPTATLAIKDEYTFDFLALTEEYSEYELEQQLLSNVAAFCRRWEETSPLSVISTA